MEHEEGTFKGFDDKNIYFQSWKGASENKGTVIISHGYGEHSGRHLNVAKELVNAGFSVYGLDHRGHGKSEGKTNHVKRFTDYFKDLEIFEKIVRGKETGPFHLFGHSMGSIIACNYIGIYNKESKFNSLILTGTGASPGPGVGKVVQVISVIISKILPGLSVSSGVDPEFISHDHDVVKAYIEDPLVNYKKITARLGSEFFSYTSKMSDSAKNITIPVFIGIGAEDETFGNWELLRDSFPNEDKKMKIYENMRHEICNELQKEIPINDIKDWIQIHN